MSRRPRRQFDVDAILQGLFYVLVVAVLVAVLWRAFA